MFLKEDREVYCESKYENDSMPPLKDCLNEKGIEYTTKGESLIAKCALNMQVKEEGLEQRKNILHTRCLIGGKVCIMIIDGRSCTNVASTTLMEKLGLKCVKHSKSYKLQWLNDSGEMKVTKQVEIPFAIGRYFDEVTCDVVQMQADHLLL